MTLSTHSQEVARLLPVNPELASYTSARVESVIGVLDSISSLFTEYTDHSSAHSLAVLRVGSLLSAGNDLNPWEKAVFALAAYHHDVGMSCDQDEFAAILKSEPFRLNRRYMERTLAPVIRLEVTGSRTLDHFMVVEFLRQTHALRTAEWIRKHYPKERSDSYVAGVYLWEAVALIAQAHGVDLESLDPARYRSDTLSGQGVQINLPYLSCLLRLADLCHFARDRALPYVREAKQFCSSFLARFGRNTGTSLIPSRFPSRV